MNGAKYRVELTPRPDGLFLCDVYKKRNDGKRIYVGLCIFCKLTKNLRPVNDPSGTLSALEKTIHTCIAIYKLNPTADIWISGD